MSKDTEIELTMEMVESLVKFFPRYAKDGVVKINCNNMGLWFVNPSNGTHQFIGRVQETENNPSTSEPKQAKQEKKKPTLN
ncbi:hypothetical protein F9L33_13320 [Amylibacter sp. SFDW26]|uniref:hypothetical protein n=1 Tax=Amylibacter sp. SFDW26 TaxID=2652722 RepID=UPI001262849B|nr:hypothetical protein [Amylibacter sp. SFDW26]KAB7610286.1 hypothetical protein F9L33_13320 [Amylibacter sp. SFDW26]